MDSIVVHIPLDSYIVLQNMRCHIAGKPEALAEGLSSISTVGGNKIMRKDDSAKRGVLMHDQMNMRRIRGVNRLLTKN
jgi:hypothetical protein